MVEQIFTVTVPVVDASDTGRLVTEMERALSVWFHREVGVQPVATSTSDDE